MFDTTYYDVYETLPVIPDGNPYCMGKARLINPHDKFTTKEEARAFLNKKRDVWHSFLKKELVNAEEASVVEHLTTQLLETKYEIKKNVVKYTHASYMMWSDVGAYEIVKVISDNTLEIREMGTQHYYDDRPTEYWSLETAPTIRIRRKKNDKEAWGYKSMRFVLNTQPYGYRDPHF